MNKGVLIILLSLVVFQISLVKAKGECSPDLPHLEAGHIQLSDKNYTKWKKDNSKLHVLGLSDSSCQQCC